MSPEEEYYLSLQELQGFINAKVDELYKLEHSPRNYPYKPIIIETVKCSLNAYNMQYRHILSDLLTELSYSLCGIHRDVCSLVGEYLC